MPEPHPPSSSRRNRGELAVALVLAVGGLAVVVSELASRAAACGAVLGVAIVYGIVEVRKRTRARK